MVLEKYLQLDKIYSSPDNEYKRWKFSFRIRSWSEMLVSALKIEESMVDLVYISGFHLIEPII